MCANALKFLPISSGYQEKRTEKYNHSTHFTAQPLSIPLKPLRESRGELGSGDVLDLLSRHHSVGMVEEKVMGTTVLGEVCHQV